MQSLIWYKVKWFYGRQTDLRNTKTGPGDNSDDECSPTANRLTGQSQRASDLVIIMHQKASRLDGLRGWAVTNKTCGMYGLRGKAQEQTDSHTESWRGKGSISEDEESQCKCFQGTVSGPGRSRVHILPILGSAMSHVRWWQLFLSLGSCKMCLKKKKLRRKKVCKRHNNKKGKTKKNILKSRTICACLKIVYAIVLFWQQTVDAEIWFDL